jgi:cyclophilin family peptidyl-prolyl cis-trans isomerase
LIKGLDVLDKIGDTPTVTGPDGARSKPTERVTINSVEIVPADSAK